jgi:hypothetical protein
MKKYFPFIANGIVVTFGLEISLKVSCKEKCILYGTIEGQL